MELTTLITISLGTFGAYIGYRTFFLNNLNSLKTEVRLTNWDGESGSIIEPADKNTVFVTVTNVNKRQIKIAGAEMTFLYDKNQAISIEFQDPDNEFPKELQDGDFCHFRFPLSEGFQNGGTLKILSLTINNTTGKKFKVPVKSLKRVISEYKVANSR